jgi:hypothetical protein
VTGPAGSGGGGGVGIWNTYYDKVDIVFTATNVTTSALTQVSSSVASVTNNGATTLTITMNAGYMPYQLVVTGYQNVGGTITTKNNIGVALSGTAVLSNLSTAPNVYTWTQCTTANMSTASGGSGTLFILSRPTTL